MCESSSMNSWSCSTFGCLMADWKTISLRTCVSKLRSTSGCFSMTLRAAALSSSLVVQRRTSASEPSPKALSGPPMEKRPSKLGGNLDGHRDKHPLASGPAAAACPSPCLASAPSTTGPSSGAAAGAAPAPSSDAGAATSETRDSPAKNTRSSFPAETGLSTSSAPSTHSRPATPQASDDSAPAASTPAASWPTSGAASATP
mmetsp:Transcript_131539/g.420809  ORF Transcript_131539/g.420809 Transcript_131539/m.420809 type:complete len:202 (-) Transcript_131539:176-781(-)